MNKIWKNRKFRLYGIIGAIFALLIFLLVDRDVAEPVVVETSSDEITSLRFWILLVVGTIALLVWGGVKYTSSKLQGYERYQRAAPPAWGFVALLGITVLHWLWWSAEPEAWGQWLESSSFWPMNIAAILALFLISQKGMTRFIGIVIAILVLIFAYQKYGDVFLSPAPAQASYRPHLPSPPLGRLPAEIALPVIAQCESRGRQFDKNGKVVTNTNRNGTVDKGKWQINSVHNKELKKRQINIETEAGNERFARILYERNYLADWEATRHCWGPKLLALGGQLAAPSINLEVVTTREWSEPIRLPLGRKVDWTAREKVAYQIMTADGKVVTFPAERWEKVKVPSLLAPWFKFRTVEADMVIIDVVAYVPL